MVTDSLTFTLAGAGLAAVSIAALAWLGERRRLRRKHLDDVGFMPWTSIFFFALLCAVVLIGYAARFWLAS